MQDNNSSFENELNNNGRLIYTNVGVSMMPLIRENKDILLIEKTNPDDLKKYDVVLFKRNNIKGRGEYVLHRILKVLPQNKYFIVGDNCTSGEIVESGQILGVLKSVTRADKPVSFESFSYKMYVLFWCAPYHIRFFVLRTKNAVKYLVSGIKYKLGITEKK